MLREPATSLLVGRGCQRHVVSNYYLCFHVAVLLSIVLYAGGSMKLDSRIGGQSFRYVFDTNSPRFVAVCSY